MVCTNYKNNTNNPMRPLCLNFQCVCVCVWCTAGAVGLGEAEPLLDNFRKLSHLPAKLKRGQKGRIKIGSLPCPEPLHTHTQCSCRVVQFGGSWCCWLWRCGALVVGSLVGSLWSPLSPQWSSGQPPQTDGKIWSTDDCRASQPQNSHL